MTTEHQKRTFRTEGMLNAIARRMRASAELALPAVPALVDHYVDMLDAHFGSLGRRFSGDELSQLRSALLSKLEEGFHESPHSSVLVRYNTADLPDVAINYAIAAAPSTVSEQYAAWTITREPPLFGKHPDAKVMHLAEGLSTPAGAACLDLGAGTGRNTLPLARRGHPVDAVELTPALAQLIVRAVESDNLDVQVHRGNVLDRQLALRFARYAFILAAELTSHLRGLPELRSLMERIDALLAPGGTALVQAFVAAEGYQPDSLARELSQTAWSTLFTYADIEAATEHLSLRLRTDESVLEYERLHALPEAWPPTPWFESWAAGHDLFGNYGARPPMELRWLTYVKDAS